MSDLRLSGLASGLDTSSLISQLMAFERRPITLMQNKVNAAQAKIDMFRQINTKLVALQRAADKVKFANFASTSAPTASSSDSTKLTGTADSTAVSGTYTVNVLSLANNQLTGGGLFTAPTGGTTSSMSNAGLGNVTLGAGAATGTYNLNVTSLAQVQITGGGTFNAPQVTGSGTNLTGVSVNNTAAAGVNTYTLTNVQHAHGQISTGGTVAANITQNSTLTIGGVGVAVTSGMTPTQVMNKINATAGITVNASLDATNHLVLTSKTATGTFTISSNRASTLTALGLSAGTVVTQSPAAATVTINGATKTSTGGVDAFTATDLGLTGVGFTLGAGATNGSTQTLTVTNTTGSLRISDTTAGTFKDVSITAGMTATQVANAINAAGAGMTASVNGSGNLVLTGNTVGETFTIGDTAGGNALATALGIDSAGHTTQNASLASLSVDGGAPITSTTNTFNNPIPGVTFDALSTGTSTLTISNAAGTLRITDNAAGTYKDVVVNSGDTLNTIAANINAANTGMTASVQSGTLMLSGNAVGKSFTVADATGGNAFATSLGIDSAGHTTQAASTGSISINGGAAITGTSNTYTGQIQGVTINAVAAGSATLTVTAGSAPGTQPSNDTVTAIKDMVSAFNDVISYMKQNNGYDAGTKKAGSLLGDTTANGLMEGLTRMVTGIVDDQSTYRTANTAGITLQRDGTLALDEGQLRASLDSDATALKALFTHEDGLTYNDNYGRSVKTNAIGTAAVGGVAGVVGDGVANRISAFVDSVVSNFSQYNATDANGARYQGAVLGRIDSFNKQIADLNKQIEDYNNRLAKREETLRSKFTAMEQAIAMLHNQGNRLASQFSSLGTFGP